MKVSYSQICSNLLKTLPQKQKEVLSRRFGLAASGSAEKETLESIGQSFGITRERVRQIEEDGLLKLKPQLKTHQKIFWFFKEYLKNSGGLKKEETLLSDLGGKNWQNQIYFLLNLGEDFLRYAETDDFYSFWTLNEDSTLKAKKIISSLSEKLKKIKKPFSVKEIDSLFSLNKNFLTSCLEISKKIQKNQEGRWGLLDWPEINPRGVKDKALLVFKKENKPLHFKEVASLIPKALPQTVHNELIKDPRFVLVGRGVYALREWGYEDGFVKDVIFKTLKEAGKPLSKDKILEKVLKQRLVKENTVLLNLADKKYFTRTTNNFYIIREA